MLYENRDKSGGIVEFVLATQNLSHCKESLRRLKELTSGTNYSILETQIKNRDKWVHGGIYSNYPNAQALSTLGGSETILTLHNKKSGEDKVIEGSVWLVVNKKTKKVTLMEERAFRETYGEVPLENRNIEGYIPR